MIRTNRQRILMPHSANLVRVLTLLCFVFMGCVRTLHPIYQSSDVVFKTDLIGTWKQSDDKGTWQFSEAVNDTHARGYRLVMTDSEGRPGIFLVHLVKLQNELFLDLFPERPVNTENSFYQFHLRPVHTFVHLKINQNRLELRPMDPVWLERHLQQNPEAIDHTILTTTGHLPEPDDDESARQILLTASTSELQRFLLENVTTADAFGDTVVLTPLKPARSTPE